MDHHNNNTRYGSATEKKHALALRKWEWKQTQNKKQVEKNHFIRPGIKLESLLTVFHWIMFLISWLSKNQTQKVTGLGRWYSCFKSYLLDVTGLDLYAWSNACASLQNCTPGISNRYYNLKSSLHSKYHPTTYLFLSFFVFLSTSWQGDGANLRSNACKGCMKNLKLNKQSCNMLKWRKWL